MPRHATSRTAVVPTCLLIACRSPPRNLSHYLARYVELVIISAFALPFEQCKAYSRLKRNLLSSTSATLYPVPTLTLQNEKNEDVQIADLASEKFS